MKHFSFMAFKDYFIKLNTWKVKAAVTIQATKTAKSAMIGSKNKSVPANKMAMNKKIKPKFLTRILNACCFCGSVCRGKNTSPLF